MEACNCNGRGAQSMVGSDGQAGRGRRAGDPLLELLQVWPLRPGPGLRSLP